MNDHPPRGSEAALCLTYKAIADSSPDVIICYDLKRRRTYVSPAYEALFGDGAKLVGTAIADYCALPPDAAAIMDNAIGEVIATGVATDTTFHCPQGNGEGRWFQMRAVPQRGDDGNLASVLAYSRDITDLKQQEMQLQLHEREFRTLAEHAQDCISRYAPDGTHLYVNPALARLLNVGVDSLMGKRISELYPSPEAAALQERIMDVARTGESCDYDHILPDEDGNAIVHSIRMTAERDDAGRIVSVLAIGHDVTARRRNEATLAERAAEFRALAENSPDCIVRYDLGLRRLYVNPAYEDLTGMPARSALGRTPLHGSYLPPAEAMAYQERLREVMATGSPLHFEIAFKRADGKGFAQHIVAVPERGPDGAVVSVLTIARDISALKEAQGRLEQAEAMARLGYWQWNAQDDILTLSAEVCRIFGKPRDWAPSTEEVFQSILPEDRDWIRTMLRVAFASRSPDVSLDYRIEAGEHMLDLHSSVRIEYGQDDNPVLLVGTAQDVSRIKHYEERMHALAYYDALTSLPNRDLFADRLRHATAGAANRHRELAVLILDLDNFKAVNDTLGHEAGDRILREAAARLRRSVGEHDTLARLGGDEFGIVLSDLAADFDLAAACRGMLDTLGEAFQIDGEEIFLTGSIGVARYPADAHDVPALLQYADAAMYHAKEAGRNNHQFYAASLTRRITQRLTLAAHLRRAEANRELELYYQPQIDLASGKLVGAEALLRWNHSEQGLLTPDRFIDIAEETGFIVGIGAWVLRAACEAAREWNAGRKTPLKIAVNLSSRQFNADLLAIVSQTLAETRCDPSWIELEITESLLVDETMDVGRILDALRAMGLTVAIDDFGTGYSALSYLNRFRVDVIKIDRSFVRHITTRRDSAELIKAIIAMAHSLRLDLVAEGIEEADQEQFLRRHGCQFGQGYLYGKPMPAGDFVRLTEAGNGNRDLRPSARASA